MASSSRISYPLLWAIIAAMLVAVGLTLVVITRTQSATTPHTPDELALISWQQAAKANPLDAGAHMRLGFAYYRVAHGQKDTAKRREYLLKALAEYQASLKLNPKVDTTQYNLGLTLQELGRADEALAAFEVMVKRDKGATLATHDAGLLYLARGDIKMAITRLEMAVKAEPEAGDFRVDLAKAYVKAGRKSKAIPQLKYALAVQPSNKDAKSMLTSLTATPKGSGGK
jgi:tetratricopeptide (TPR) repeat protein